MSDMLIYAKSVTIERYLICMTGPGNPGPIPAYKNFIPSHRGLSRSRSRPIEVCPGPADSLVLAQRCHHYSRTNPARRYSHLTGE